MTSTYQLLQLLPERREAGAGISELLDEIGATSFDHYRRPVPVSNPFVEYILERIADGEAVMPTPYLNLDVAIRRGLAEHDKWQSMGAPPDVLENLRRFIVTAMEMQRT